MFLHKRKYCHGESNNKIFCIDRKRCTNYKNHPSTWLLMTSVIISQYDFPPPIRLKHYIAESSPSEGGQNQYLHFDGTQCIAFRGSARSPDSSGERGYNCHYFFQYKIFCYCSQCNTQFLSS